MFADWEGKMNDYTLETKDETSIRNGQYSTGPKPMVEVEPLICTLRLKGKRMRYSINWETVFCAAAEIAARKLREERKQKREERKKNKIVAV